MGCLLALFDLGSLQWLLFSIKHSLVHYHRPLGLFQQYRRSFSVIHVNETPLHPAWTSWPLRLPLPQVGPWLGANERAAAMLAPEQITRKQHLLQRQA